MSFKEMFTDDSLFLTRYIVAFKLMFVTKKTSLSRR